MMSVAVPILLSALALVDGAFAGFRDAAGRNPLLFKGSYYKRAALRGLGYGVVVATVGGSTVLAALWWSSTPEQLYAAYVDAGARMVWVYGGYASLVIPALLIYLLPRPEISSLATVLVLGPFTLGRPWVILGGALYAIYTQPLWPILITIVVAASPLALAGPILSRLVLNPRDLERQAQEAGLELHVLAQTTTRETLRQEEA